MQAGAGAVVQSEGATVLAAGQKVEITGRGLEGIRLEVQAPANEAVNLGTLQGDAVGIFAGTLRHSGLIAARASDTEGGKVVLKAIGGDNRVDGTRGRARGQRQGRQHRRAGRARRRWWPARLLRGERRTAAAARSASAATTRAPTPASRTRSAPTWTPARASRPTPPARATAAA